MAKKLTYKINFRPLRKAAVVSAMLLGFAIQAGAQMPGGVAANLTSWFKANSQTGGNILPNTNHNTPVNEWKSELGNLSVTQGTASRMPLFLADYTAAANFNFNPSMQFASSQGRGLVNTSTSIPDVLGNNGTYFLVINTNRETGVTSSTCFSYISNNTGARYQAKADFRIQTGVTSGFGYIADLDPASTGLNPAGIPAINYPGASGIILTSRSAGPTFRARRNADTTILGSGSIYYPAIGTGIGVGFNSPGGGEATSSAIAELITYDTYLSDADVNKVESYLAVKYGITLGQGTSFTLPVGPTNYTSSNGTVIWNAAANTGYANCITGIGRDDNSALLQKQSKSIHDSSLVYLFNGNTGGLFPAMNVNNISALTANNSFLLCGDNGLSTGLTACVYNSRFSSMKRVWKVQKTGAIGIVTVAVDAAGVNAQVKNLLVSANPLFPAVGTAIYPLSAANGKLYAAVNLNSNEYFTFASDSLKVQTTVTQQPTCTASNGGAVTATVTGGTTPYTYSWNTTPVQTTATATGLTGGSYVLTVTAASGCAVGYPVTLVTPLFPVISAATSQAVTCQGDSVVLTASVVSGTVSNYTWMPGSVTGNSIKVAPADTTDYSVIGIDAATGCADTAWVTIFAKEIPASTFTLTPGNVCLGTPQTITYTGNAPNTATYNWFGFAGATVQSGSGKGPYSIVLNSAGTNTIQLQVENNGCLSTITTQKDTIAEPVTASFTVSDDEVCAGTVITATFTGTTAYATTTATWGWGGGAIQSGSGFGPYNVQYKRSGIISLTIKNGACVAVANSQVINVIPVPVAAFSADVTKGCPPFAVTFTNESQSSSAWKWHFGSGDSSVDVNPVYTYNDPGVYTVTLIASSQNKCFDTLVKTDYIAVKPMPEADFTATPVENIDVELHLATFSFSNASDNAGSYKWHFGDGDSSIYISPQHRYLFPGNYTVILEAMNDIGCADTAVRQFFKVIPDKVLDIPNAFSPNGDGVNDTWEIAGLRGAADCRVEIYNRWGEQLYSSRGYANPWDGAWKGKPVPVATYYYVIKTATRSYNGWVAVIR